MTENPSGAELLILAIALYESAIRCRREVYDERGDYLETQMHWSKLSELTKDRWLEEAKRELARLTEGSLSG